MSEVQSDTAIDPRNGENQEVTRTQSAEQEMHRNLEFAEMARILRRRWMFVLAMTIFGMLAAGVVGLLIAPKYTASAQLLIELRKPDRIKGQEPEGDQSTEEAIQSTLQTHVISLQSQDFLRRVLSSVTKADNLDGQTPAAEQQADAGRRAAPAPIPSQNPAADEALSARLARQGLAMLSRIKANLHVWLEAFTRTEPGEAQNLKDIEKRLKVQQELQSRVISVSLTLKDPAMAAAIVNGIAHQYVADQLAQKQGAVKLELDNVREQIAVLRREAARANSAAERLLKGRLDQEHAEGGGHGFNDQHLRELLNQATDARQRAPALERSEAQLQSQFDRMEPDVRIISMASVPDQPSSTNPLLFMAPAAILFSLGAGYWVVVRAVLDRKLRTAQDIATMLGVPCLALAPKLSRAQRTRPEGELSSRPFSRYSQAVQAIVAGLSPPTPGGASSDGCQVVMVTSSLRGEGKTLLARSLASAYTMMCPRVLLIEVAFPFDSPPTSRTTNSSTVGKEIQTGNEDWSPSTEVVRSLTEGYDYLKLEGWPPALITLLSSQKMTRLFEGLRSQYDYVVIDSRAILRANETTFFAPFVDKVLFVIKWGETQADVAESALRTLRPLFYKDKAPDFSLAAVLTQAP